MSRFVWTLSVLCVIAALAVVPASAAVVAVTPTAITQGQEYSARSGIVTVFFEGGLGLLPAGYNESGVTYSPAEIENGFASNYAAPTSGTVPGKDKTNYLTVGSNTGYTPITITFSGHEINYFGLYLGSPDSYNKITFNFVNGDTGVCGGGCLSGGVTSGSQVWAAYVDFDFRTRVDSIVLSSSSAALESDNHSFYLMPEPASLAMLGLGLVAIAVVRRRRMIR
jgi:hypothetical protein